MFAFKPGVPQVNVIQLNPQRFILLLKDVLEAVPLLFVALVVAQNPFFILFCRFQLLLKYLCVSINSFFLFNFLLEILSSLLDLVDLIDVTIEVSFGGASAEVKR